MTPSQAENQSLITQSAPGMPNRIANAQNPMGAANAMGGAEFDIWGPLQRRKYLVILFCLIGTALGYLHYSKTPKKYSSFTRLMITTQAPPVVVDGDLKLERVSLSKHANLIASELVLNDALVNGELDQIPSFQGKGYPVGSLKSMLRVTPDAKSDETLTITCTGTNPNDLPEILTRVVAAYQKSLEEDTQSFGKDQSELIEELRGQLTDEKRTAETRRLELYQELGTSSVTNDGFVINPHEVNAKELSSQHSIVKTELRKLNDRHQILNESLKDENENAIKIAAIEAKKYLNLTRAQFEDQKVQNVYSQPNTLVRVPNVTTSRPQLETRLWDAKTSYDDLNMQRTELSSTFGGGHTKVKALDKRIGHFATQILEIQSELDEYDKEIVRLRKEEEAKMLAAAEAAKTEVSDEPKIDLETFRAQEDRQWIQLYSLYLDREEQRLQLELAALGDELKSESGKAKEMAGHVMELNILNKQISEQGETIRIILDQLKQVNILNNSFTMTKVKTLDSATRGRQVAPSLAKSLTLGTMLAFLAGFGLALLIDQSELSFRSPHEIWEKLQIPVVGRIPRINIRKIQPTSKAAASLVAAHNPGATASESFRDIRTALFFQTNVDGTKTILFTSPSPGDGKSTTVANLAISIAQAGKRVILVDADFRRPRVDKYFEEPISPGLLGVLQGECSLSQGIRNSEVQSNLYLLTAGGRPKNPAELISSEQFRSLIDALKEKFDYVLIDSPPVLPVSDPAAIASFVDGVYMVTRIRKGIKLTSQRAKETLDRVGTRWLGIIINGLDENPHYTEYGYQYGTYSYYGGVYGRYYEANNKEYREKIKK